MQYLLEGVKMTTIDPNADVAVYGSTHQHFIDTLQNIGTYAKPGTYDLAIVNGVVG